MKEGLCLMFLTCSILFFVSYASSATESTQSQPHLIEVQADNLFDVVVKTLHKGPVETGELIFSVSLLNIGSPGRVTVVLTYQVQSLDGKLLIHETESLFVETQKEFIKRLNVSSLSDGRYTLIVDLSYPDKKQPALAKKDFTVQKKERSQESSSGNSNTMTTVIVVLIILLLLYICYKVYKAYRAFKSRVKKKESVQN